MNSIRSQFGLRNQQEDLKSIQRIYNEDVSMIDTLINGGSQITCLRAMVFRRKRMVTITSVDRILQLAEVLSGGMVGSRAGSGASLRSHIHLHLFLKLLISVQIVVIVSEHHLLFLSHGDDCCAC